MTLCIGLSHVHRDVAAAVPLNGLGLTGPPTIYSTPYLKGDIEGGQYFNWFYNDGDNGGRGLDPSGTDLQVSLPPGRPARAGA